MVYHRFHRIPVHIPACGVRDICIK
jgi:hypothetical protein